MNLHGFEQFEDDAGVRLLAPYPRAVFALELKPQRGLRVGELLGFAPSALSSLERCLQPSGLSARLRHFELEPFDARPDLARRSLGLAGRSLGLVGPALDLALDQRRVPLSSLSKHGLLGAHRHRLLDAVGQAGLLGVRNRRRQGDRHASEHERQAA